ncbi:DUF6153 family protein [Streptomyces sp. NPDC093105]|uniref:DUF6153 family protein n=1 Tax=Streptomyces sp. NPDC093105 TaxID=3366029 RepID=UPI00381F6836
MSRGKPSASPQPVLRLTMLLVIAVLTGLVAMHGLGSASPLPAGAALPHSAHQTVTAAAAPPCACHDVSSTDRHVGHADQMCMSGAVAGAVFVPALPACSPGGIDTAASPPLPVSYEPSGGRSPPTLAQLQLLRN